MNPKDIHLFLLPQLSKTATWRIDIFVKLDSINLRLLTAASSTDSTGGAFSGPINPFLGRVKRVLVRQAWTPKWQPASYSSTS